MISVESIPKPLDQLRKAGVLPWMDLVLCFLAVLGLGSTLVQDFHHVTTLDYVATDYKTLYASAALFRAGADPYAASALDTIYRRDAVAKPHSTFGRMPVYPPVTLLVLWPLTYLPMGVSAVAWWVISLVAVAGGAAALLAEARRLNLNWIYRTALLVLIAGSPMLAFAVNIGNVSPVVGALCTIALVVAVRAMQGNTAVLVAASVCLGLALCVKPHSAFWVAAGIALVCGRVGRRIAAGGVLLLGTCLLSSGVILWARGQLDSVLHSFLNMLAQERTNGSMSPQSREVLPVLGQITGVSSLFGIRISAPARGWLVGLVLAALLAVLAVLAWKSRDRERCPEWQILFISALVAVGIVATYHRAHDAVLLTGTVGLWICTAVRRSLTDPHRYRLYVGASAAILGIFACQWFTLPVSASQRATSPLHRTWLGDLLTFRQGAFFALWLAIALILGVWLASKKDGTNGLRSVPGGQ